MALPSQLVVTKPADIGRVFASAGRSQQLPAHPFGSHFSLYDARRRGGGCAGPLGRGPHLRPGPCPVPSSRVCAALGPRGKCRGPLCFAGASGIEEPPGLAGPPLCKALSGHFHVTKR